MNAPFSWPNSSLSSRVSVSAPQLTLMNGPIARLLSRWIARATSSLPVPLSPAMNTVVSLAATFSTVRRTASIRSPAPTSSGKWPSASALR